MKSVRELVNALLKLEEQQPGSLDTNLLCIGKKDDEYTLLSTNDIPSELTIKYFFKSIHIQPSIGYKVSVRTHFDADDAEYRRIVNKGNGELKVTPMHQVINLLK